MTVKTSGCNKGNGQLEGSRVCEGWGSRCGHGEEQERGYRRGKG